MSEDKYFTFEIDSLNIRESGNQIIYPVRVYEKNGNESLPGLRYVEISRELVSDLRAVPGANKKEDGSGLCVWELQVNRIIKYRILAMLDVKPESKVIDVERKLNLMGKRFQ